MRGQVVCTHSCVRGTRRFLDSLETPTGSGRTLPRIGTVPFRTSLLSMAASKFGGKNECVPISVANFGEMQHSVDELKGSLNFAHHGDCYKRKSSSMDEGVIGRLARHLGLMAKFQKSNAGSNEPSVISAPW